MKKRKKYEGKFIATQSFNHKTVISYGVDPLEVLSRAKSKGFSSPVVNFIPKGPCFY